MTKSMGVGRGGSNRKPAAVKALQGNVGKRPPKDKKKPASKNPPRKPEPVEMPEGLTVEEIAVWEYYSKIIKKMGFLIPEFRDTLYILCVAVATMRKAKKEIKRMGHIMKRDNGSLVKNPWINIYNDSAAQMRGLSGVFGLDPVSRDRIDELIQIPDTPKEAGTGNQKPSLKDFVSGDKTKH